MNNGFPGIIGAIDGTQIAIRAPPVNDENFPAIVFYNRKGFYSLNVQIVNIIRKYKFNFHLNILFYRFVILK